jgi:membrane-associated phospholipid phosphatase
MSIVAFVFIAVADRRLAHEYLFAFVLLFLVGVLWVYAVPTWGPTYSLPDRFQVFSGTDVHELQYALWVMKEQLVQDPTRRDAVFMISGFPSLHVAVLILGSLYLRRIHYMLALLSWSVTLLVVHATIYLGWHYVLDDVGSVLLVAVCIPIARWAHWPWRRDLTTEQPS